MNDYTITKVHAREILDSMGQPALEVDVFTRVWRGRAKLAYQTPTSSGGKREAERQSQHDLLAKTVRAINDRASATLRGLDSRRQSSVDRALETLPTAKGSLYPQIGIPSLSIATARVAAHCRRMHFYRYVKTVSKNKSYRIPVPIIPVLEQPNSSGQNTHARCIMLMPIGTDLTASLLAASRVLAAIGARLEANGGAAIGPMGGYVMKMNAVREGLDIVIEAIKSTGNADTMKIGVSIGAVRQAPNDQFVFDGKNWTEAALLRMYEELARDYPIRYIEDPFPSDQPLLWTRLTTMLGKKVYVAISPNAALGAEQVRKAARAASYNCIGLSPYNARTWSATLATYAAAKRAGITVLAAGVMNETEDTLLADVAIGLGCPLINAGGLLGSEHTAKYNELLRIASQLGGKATYGDL